MANPITLQWAARELADRLGLPENETVQIAEFLSGLPSANELRDQLVDMMGASNATWYFAESFAERVFPSTPRIEALGLPVVANSRSQRAGRKAGKGKAPARDKSPAPSVATSGRSSPQQPDAPAALSPDESVTASEKGKRPSTRKRRGKKGDKSVTDVWGAAQIERLKTLTDRPACPCAATVHALLRNCIDCGRIVCTVEGPGPCLTCGRLVITREHESLMDPADLPADYHLENIGGADSLALDEALALRDRLLEADHTAAQNAQRLLTAQRAGTGSLDAHDVRWMSKQERAEYERRQRQQIKRDAELEEKRRRGTQVLSIDLVTKKVTRRALVASDLPAPTPTKLAGPELTTRGNSSHAVSAPDIVPEYVEATVAAAAHAELPVEEGPSGQRREIPGASFEPDEDTRVKGGRSRPRRKNKGKGPR
ncbi:Activating signal cointegrator 1 [Tieghemiomyces parasiticus]|uniref:Activating signal cointegrator 1 n=1 Tax=Tieghemiomyces parasiticus TaxID=78921 RepID=A0A9W8DXX0_9FUNG|nr:Activating signal cointegrator 1 [Tieghemiomyces parasiticus]